MRWNGKSATGVAAIVAAVLILSACGGTEYTRVDIRARGEVAELCATDTVDLDPRLYALNSEGREALVPEIDPALVPAWSSDNEEIATVDAEGVVTMHALGVATITLELGIPTGENTATIAVSACDCLEPVSDPTRLLEAIVTAPPVGSPTARMKVRCPAADAASGTTGCASYSGTVCWHEAIPAANTKGLGTWQIYHCADGRIERNDDASDWARQHTEVAERQGPGPLDGSGAPVFEACSPGGELEAVDLRGGSPVDYYRCRCEP